MDYLFALQNIREAAPSFINYFFLFISEITLYLGALIAANFYWSINKDDGAYILMGYAGAFSVNEFIKNLACVNRPWILDSRLHIDPVAKGSATGYSFPSGHTTIATSFFGGLALTQRKKKGLSIFFLVLILLVAFSRNWLGAHTLKDVLVAICHTSLMICLVCVLRYSLAKNPAKDTLVMALALVISITFLIILCVKKYPMQYDAAGNLLVDPKKMLEEAFKSTGTATGFFLGWWMERHLVNFEIPDNTKKRVLRSVIGSLILLLWLFLISKTLKFLGAYTYYFIKYFVTFFFMMYIYPLLFSSIAKVYKYV